VFGVSWPARARRRPRRSGWRASQCEAVRVSGSAWRGPATAGPRRRLGQDAFACLAAAVQHAEHLLQLEDLRSDRGDVDPGRRDHRRTAAHHPSGSPSCPTTGHAFAAACSPNHSPAKTRWCATSAPESRARRPTASSSGSSAPSSMSTSTRTHQRRRRPRRRSQPVPPNLQHHPTHQALHDRTPRDAYLAGRQVTPEGRYPSWSRRRVR
jgi:hypothetical protein